MSYVKRTWTIEHKVKCRYCGTLTEGAEDKCRSCGKTIDDKQEEIVPTDMSYENRVTDVKKKERFDRNGADWICGYCSCRNIDRATLCTECGAARKSKKGSVEVGQDTVKIKNLKGAAKIDMAVEPGSPFKTNIEVSDHGVLKDVTIHGDAKVSLKVGAGSSISGVTIGTPGSKRKKESSISWSSPARPALHEDENYGTDKHATVQVGEGYRGMSVEIPVPLTRWELFTEWLDTKWEHLKAWVSDNLKTIGVVAAGATVIALVIWLCVYLFTFHPTDARVSATRWHWHVSLHQRQIDHDNDWRDEMHPHAFNVSCHRDIRSYSNCHPHDCNPHPVSYDCRCHSVESCHTSCRSNGNRSSSCSESCSSHEECSTCYRTEYDTCYDRCPNYDDMCSYDYPAWPEVNHADTNNSDHTPVRPNLSAQGGQSCPSDPELLHIEHPELAQCTIDSTDYHVNFNAGENGQYSVEPTSQSDYDRYQTGAVWHAEYNHAGMFHPLYPHRIHR